MNIYNVNNLKMKEDRVRFVHTSYGLVAVGGVEVTCPRCGGSGITPPKPGSCRKCGGTGKVRVPKK